MCSPRRIIPTPPLDRLGADKTADHIKQYKFRNTTNETTGTQSISFRELKGVAAENYRYRLPLVEIQSLTRIFRLARRLALMGKTGHPVGDGGSRR